MKEPNEKREMHNERAVPFTQLTGPSVNRIDPKKPNGPNKAAVVYHIIKDTIEAGVIRCHDETVGSRARKYLPRWA